MLFHAWVAPRLALNGGQQDPLATLSCLTVPSFSEVPRLGQAPGGLSDAANKIVLIDGPVVFKKKNLEEREQWEEEELKGPPNRKARRLHLQPEGAALTKGGGVFSLARENEPQKRKLLATKGPAREDPKSGITRIWRRESTPAGSHARVFKLMLFDAWVAPRLRSTRVKKILLRPRAASPCHHFQRSRG